MLSQGVLIATDEEKEFESLQEKILIHNRAFGDLSEDRRRFVVNYLLLYPKHNMKTVADRSGISKSLCFELAKDPELMAMMISAAQAISGLGDLRCSIALDLLADEMCKQIAKGSLGPESITPTMLRILEQGKTRLGLNPVALNALRMSVTGKDGSKAEISMASSGNDTDSVLSELWKRQRGSIPDTFEAEILEMIQPQSRLNNEAVPISEKSKMARGPGGISQEKNPSADILDVEAESPSIAAGPEGENPIAV